MPSLRLAAISKRVRSLALSSAFAGATAWGVQVQPRGEFIDRTLEIQRAINQCRMGGEVIFAAGTYAVSTLQLKPACTYRGEPGKSVLKLLTKNKFIFDLSERSNIRIEGLAFDGNSLGGALLAERYAPVRNIHVENCAFRNVVSASVYPANVAIFSSWGLIDSEFLHNSFLNIASGLLLTTVQRVTISGNTFQDVTQGDAIFIAPNPVSFPSGDRLIIADNSGSGLAKMGIEIFRPDPPNGSRLVEPLIENNSFSRFTATNNEGMGLSVTHGDGATIRNNTIDNTEGKLQQNGIGIEVIVRNGRITNNTITHGMGFGIAVQGTPGSVITSNQITGMWQDGILFACDNSRHRCDSSGSRVEGNTIVNARLNGIRLDNNWSQSSILLNTITRAAGAWQDDRTLAFKGIRMGPAKQSVTVRGNTVTQTSRVAPDGFSFHGIELNPDVPNAIVSGNHIRSMSSRPLGEGIVGRGGPGWVVENNELTNLTRER